MHGSHHDPQKTSRTTFPRWSLSFRGDLAGDQVAEFEYLRFCHLTKSAILEFDVGIVRLNAIHPMFDPSKVFLCHTARLTVDAMADEVGSIPRSVKA
jgi:hypothetical protein